MSELYENVILCKLGKKEAMEYMLEKFKGLIKSTSLSFDRSKFFNNYDVEDNEYDLIVDILEIVKKIPIMNKGFENDGSIVNYINRAIINRKKDMYINKKRKSDNLLCQYDVDITSVKDDVNFLDIESNVLLDDLFKDLTEKERKVIEYKFIKEKSDVEIGEILSISRQAVNKTKNRALKKLKAVI